ncbi:MAG TPA: TIGR03667 family PPOX class F420-dependent oxidoreductase [Ktedonobacter sp.]|nr:TIGR03667 family PPOX class F420-dependent oxidoreductase [Ktedonobacter sp.]
MADTAKPQNAHVEERLQTESIIWLTSVRADGRPHLVPVWFYWDGSTVLIFSQPNNQKIRNLRHNSNVMLALEAKDGGDDVVLFEGKAELLQQPAAQVLPSGYEQKYAEGLKNLGMSKDQMMASYSQPIRITPTKFISWT